MPVKPTRQLLVIADDIGIGPNTTAGILQLGGQGIVTGSVLLVNSPYAEEAVALLAPAPGEPDLTQHPADRYHDPDSYPPARGVAPTRSQCRHADRPDHRGRLAGAAVSRLGIVRPGNRHAIAELTTIGRGEPDDFDPTRLRQRHLPN